jgi:predicted nucleic acid-binding protein
MTVMRTLGRVTIVTTEEVLCEYLAYYSGHGVALRKLAVGTIERALVNPLVIVRPQSHQTFLDGLSLYKSRPDKGYSLTDCISMQAMHQEGITEVLTHDAHFAQEGFALLL